MGGYRIKFMDDFVNRFGHSVHYCQDAIEIRPAQSRYRAIEAAKHGFTRRQHIPD